MLLHALMKNSKILMVILLKYFRISHHVHKFLPELHVVTAQETNSFNSTDIIWIRRYTMWVWICNLHAGYEITEL